MFNRKLENAGIKEQKREEEREYALYFPKIRELWRSLFLLNIVSDKLSAVVVSIMMVLILWRINSSFIEEKIRIEEIVV